ncbi:DNA mismatch repair protein, partial [Rhodocollybia butyracea]
FHDLTTLTSFGFRGEALSSLCALCETVTVTTATVDKAPMGAVLELDKRGEPKSRGKGVRQRGTTVLLVSPFAPLPVRRKELERNIKREFGKALTLLNAYALGPCCGLAVRLSVTNQPEKGYTTHISLPLSTSNGSTPSLRTVRAGTTALWGSKALDGVIDLELEFDANDEDEVEETFKISVQGLISSPTPTPGSGSTPRPGTAGRTATDRQFFYVNGRPCTMNKIQKAINETYRSFLPSNSTSGQFPFIIIDFSIPGDAVDVNVTPDKRTILVHAEAELCTRMKVGQQIFEERNLNFIPGCP